MVETAIVTDRPAPAPDTKSLVVAAVVEEGVVKATESPALVTNGQAEMAAVEEEEALGAAVESEKRSVSVHFEILFIHILSFF